MAFDGTIETCPNYDEQTELLNQSFDWWEDPQTNNDPQKGSPSFNSKCFNICPSDPEDLNQSSYYIDNQSGTPQCMQCPDPDDGSTNPNDDRYRDPPLPGTVQDLINRRIYGMCSNNPNPEPEIDLGDSRPGPPHPTPEWFMRQQDGNITQAYVNRINWRTQDVREIDRLKRLWRNADRGMTNNEILRILGRKRPGTLEYTLPEEYMDGNTPNYDKLRTDINEGRGSIIPCDGGVGLDWLDPSPVCAGEEPDVGDDGTLTCTGPCVPENPGNANSKCKSPDADLGQCYNTSDREYVRDNGNFGPNHIIPEEVYDFAESLYGTFEVPDSSDGVRSAETFAELLSAIGSDSTFEACVNDVLNTTKDSGKDREIQERISGYESIKEFTSEDINYLKRKLRKIIVIKTNDLNECMNLLNLGESVCATGIADKTLQIGRLIFSIVGNDKVDVLNMDNDEKIKLNRLIDELGPLIPQAVKSIIRVSKEYESRICNTPSNTTLLLERLYIDLYDKETRVNLDISPYIDFSSLINIQNDWRFIKTMCVIIVFSFLFMQFSNVVVAFLSRGPSVTKIA